MAGLSRRFTEAGYSLPKYMLPLHGRTVFSHAISSFEAFFDTTPFVFIARDVAGTADFIEAERRALGIADARIHILDHETAGQAETVEIGLRATLRGEDAPVTIFNIDTFRHKFAFPSGAWFENSDGYLEVFKGSGANWSYVGAREGMGEPVVARTTEKQPISDLCCDGLYHFARASDFFLAVEMERRAPSQRELYVAPIYNHLIALGRAIHYEVVPETLITFCGVPAEYEAACAAGPT